MLDTASEILWDTKSSLSILEKETRIWFFKKASDWIKTLLWFDWWKSVTSQWNEHSEKADWDEDSRENSPKWWDKISESMFQQLLTMESSQWFKAKTATYFGETFTTWPYGMVYKHIDKNGNLLKKPAPFREWEQLTEKRSKDNAKAYYNKCAKEWKDSLNQKWLKYDQNQLDALVSASWWTTASKNRLKRYVTSHRNKPTEIFNFMSHFATTAAWNWKVQPWLVTRRKFEANRFKWNKHPFIDYQRHRV